MSPEQLADAVEVAKWLNEKRYAPKPKIHGERHMAVAGAVALAVPPGWCVQGGTSSVGLYYDPTKPGGAVPHWDPPTTATANAHWAHARYLTERVWVAGTAFDGLLLEENVRKYAVDGEAGAVEWLLRFVAEREEVIHAQSKP